jgi:serine phosphatase RsbU (regulator of sigma subunit)
LAPGSVLALVTDGVTEAHSGDRMLELSGVSTIVQRVASDPAKAIVAAILARAAEFAGGALRDDAAVVVLKRR